MDVLLPDGRWLLELYGGRRIRLSDQYADRQLFRGGDQPYAQSRPCGDDGRLWHAGRGADGFCAARDGARVTVGSARKICPLRLLGSQYRARDDDPLQPVPIRPAPGARCAGKWLLARAKPRLSRRGAAAPFGMAAAAGRPRLHLPRRVADPHRRWAWLFEPVVGTASCRSGEPRGGCITRTPVAAG